MKGRELGAIPTVNVQTTGQARINLGRPLHPRELNATIAPPAGLTIQAAIRRIVGLTAKPQEGFSATFRPDHRHDQDPEWKGTEC